MVPSADTPAADEPANSGAPNTWNLADTFEAIAATIPDALAQRQGERTITWAEFDRRANGVAKALLDAGIDTEADDGATTTSPAGMSPANMSSVGVAEQDKVAQYLHNCPEYLETLFACFKAGLATVNTNYRYAADELVYLWDNADVVIVVFHGVFADTISPLRERLPRIHTWLWVDDGTGDCPEWATPYETAAQVGTDVKIVGPWGRSPDHLFLLYTGGTTGMPKGVMWRQADLFGALDGSNRHPLGLHQDLDALTARVTKPGPRNVPAAPLMHGTSLFNAISNLIIGGSVCTLTGTKFDVIELLDTIDEYRINSISIVGDAFAKPILAALDAEPGRWDISSLRVVLSSGVMWSAESKQGLLRHNDRLILVDALGSSEAIGIATSTTRAGDDAETAKFEISDVTRVVTEDGRNVVPGSGERGLIARRGFTPIGYYKDPDKSAATFKIIDGERYSIPGDWAEVLGDGTVKLLGRGSQCINTGGEKVYPEEVEETLKLHPSVRDAAVVGLPDDKFGSAITALVELHPEVTFEPTALIDHVKGRLARYKAPKAVYQVDSVDRADNGKLDYKALTALANHRAGELRDQPDPSSPTP